MARKPAPATTAAYFTQQHSFHLLDACHLPNTLLHGHLLLQGGGDDGGTAAAWYPTFVVLTERCLLWLTPPSSRWRGVELTHGVPQADVSPAALAEVFELSTARRTLRFRCRTSAFATRWITTLRAACENQSDGAMLGMAEVLANDYHESFLQRPLLEVATATNTESSTTPLLSKLLSLPQQVRHVPTPSSLARHLLPPPRGKYQLRGTALPFERVLRAALVDAKSSSAAAAMSSKSRAAGSARASGAESAYFNAPACQQALRQREVELKAVNALVTALHGPSPRWARQRIFGYTLETESVRPGVPSAAMHSSSLSLPLPRNSFVACLPTGLHAHSLLIEGGGGMRTPHRTTAIATTTSPASGTSDDQSAATAAANTLRDRLTGPAPLLLEAAALSGAEPWAIALAVAITSKRVREKQAVLTAAASMEPPSSQHQQQHAHHHQHHLHTTHTLRSQGDVLSPLIDPRAARLQTQMRSGSSGGGSVTSTPLLRTESSIGSGSHGPQPTRALHVAAGLRGMSLSRTRSVASATSVGGGAMSAAASPSLTGFASPWRSSVSGTNHPSQRGLPNSAQASTMRSPEGVAVNSRLVDVSNSIRNNENNANNVTPLSQRRQSPNASSLSSSPSLTSTASPNVDATAPGVRVPGVRTEPQHRLHGRVFATNSSINNGANMTSQLQPDVFTPTSYVNEEGFVVVDDIRRFSMAQDSFQSQLDEPNDAPNPSISGQYFDGTSHIRMNSTGSIRRDMNSQLLPLTEFVGNATIENNKSIDPQIRNNMLNDQNEFSMEGDYINAMNVDVVDDIGNDMDVVDDDEHIASLDAAPIPERDGELQVTSLAAFLSPRNFTTTNININRTNSVYDVDSNTAGGGGFSTPIGSSRANSNSGSSRAMPAVPTPGRERSRTVSEVAAATAAAVTAGISGFWNNSSARLASLIGGPNTDVNGTDDDTTEAAFQDAGVEYTQPSLPLPSSVNTEVNNGSKGTGITSTVSHRSRSGSDGHISSSGIIAPNSVLSTPADGSQSSGDHSWAARRLSEDSARLVFTRSAAMNSRSSPEN